MLGKFPVNQVVGCRCSLLAVNSTISLAGSEEETHFSQQSPKMLKMVSESFILALLLFLGLFRKISRALSFSGHSVYLCSCVGIKVC